MTYRSSLSRARGSGSAKEGSQHWIRQHIYSLGLIPLILWFVWLVWQLAAVHHVSEVRLILASPFNALVMVMFLMAVFYHGSLGIQMVLEDYVSGERKQLFAIMLAKIACFAGAITGIFSILSLYFRG